MCLCERLNSSSPLKAFQILLKEIIAQLMVQPSILPTLFPIICLGSSIPVSHTQGTCSYNICLPCLGKKLEFERLWGHTGLLWYEYWQTNSKGGKTLAWRGGGGGGDPE